MSKSSRSPRGQGHLLRDEILDTTARLMATVDEADDLPVRVIADAIGRTVPALYQHFPDKAALLTAAAEHALNEMGATVDAQVAEVDDIDQRLRVRARAFVAFATEHPVPYRHLFMSRPDPRAPNTIELMMNSVGFGGMVRDLTEAREAGLMVDQDPTAVALVLWTAVHGVASLLISHPTLEWPDDLLDRVLDQHAFGLVPR